ncbi:MAG: hypothetical protein II777_09620, partial [Clostridia bacterium]|nr:hypothetical protein [Clostridia bacterium]
EFSSRSEFSYAKHNLAREANLAAVYFLTKYTATAFFFMLIENLISEVGVFAGKRNQAFCFVNNREILSA